MAPLPKSSLIGTNPNGPGSSRHAPGRRHAAGVDLRRGRPAEDLDEVPDTFIAVGTAAAAVTDRLLAARAREVADRG